MPRNAGVEIFPDDAYDEEELAVLACPREIAKDSLTANLALLFAALD